MQNIAIIWTAKSSNAKTGPMPVSTTARVTCSPSCPFANGNGCYAENGPLGYLWDAMTAAGPNATFKNGRGVVTTTDWNGLCDSVAALPANTLWRHNQAGDLPHVDGAIDVPMVTRLVDANNGKRGFTYIHHDMSIGNNAYIVDMANRLGFTINLSGNSLEHADELADLEIGPVVCVLPASVQGKADIATPKGRRVVVCPATYRDDVSCKTCGLCAVRDRKVIVGFPAHGVRKNAASAIATA